MTYLEKFDEHFNVLSITRKFLEKLDKLTTNYEIDFDYVRDFITQIEFSFQSKKIWSELYFHLSEGDVYVSYDLRKEKVHICDTIMLKTETDICNFVKLIDNFENDNDKG